MYRNRRINKKWLVACCIAVAVVLISAGSVSAKIKNFSAEQVGLTADGTVNHRGMFYVTPDTVRTDMRSPDGKGTVIVIMRRDLDLYWMLNPAGKTYFERPLKEEEWQQMAQGMIKSKTEKDLGSEVVNGFKCRKKEVDMLVEFMGFKKKSRSIIWISKKLDLPIRTKTEDGHVTELRNIKKGKQPADLFKVPDGYRKVANMMALFAGSDADEEEQEGGSSGFSLPKNLGDKLKGLKLPFGK